jgi:hypothetical protein
MIKDGWGRLGTVGDGRMDGRMDGGMRGGGRWGYGRGTGTGTVGDGDGREGDSARIGIFAVKKLS